MNYVECVYRSRRTWMRLNMSCHKTVSTRHGAMLLCYSCIYKTTLVLPSAAPGSRNVDLILSPPLFVCEVVKLNAVCSDEFSVRLKPRVFIFVSKLFFIFLYSNEKKTVHSIKIETPINVKRRAYLNTLRIL